MEKKIKKEMVNGVICSRIMRLDEKVLYMAIEKPMSKSANLISGAEARWQLYYNCFFGHIRLCIYFLQDVMRLRTQYKDIKRRENY